MMNNELRPYELRPVTDIPWIESIPAHWDVQRGKAVYKKLNRPTRSNDEVVTCFRDGVVTLRKNRRTTGFTESIKEIGYQGIRKGDLVIHVMDAFAGAIGVSDSDGKGTPVYSVCESKVDLNNYYYAYVIREMAKTGFIQSLYRGIRERSSDFRFEVFANQYLPIPPLSEQDQIVKYLDHQLAKINKFIKAKKKLIAVLKEQKQAIINEAVTKGLDPNVKMKPSGIEWLGDVPGHWCSKYLFQISEEQFVSNRNHKNQNLLSLSYGKIIRKDINKTEGLLPESFDNYQVVKDGNIILRMTDLQNDKKSLRVGLVKETGIITSAYVCIRTRNIADPEFLNYVLHAYDYIKVFYGMGGGVRQSIGFPELKKIIIFMPELDEQRRIVDKLLSIDKEIANKVCLAEKEIELMTEFKNSLISDVVTGKVDVRNIVLDESEDDAIEDAELDEESIDEEILEVEDGDE